MPESVHEHYRHQQPRLPQTLTSLQLHLQQLLVLIGWQEDLLGAWAGAGVSEKGSRAPGLLAQQHHRHIGTCSILPASDLLFTHPWLGFEPPQ